MSLLLLGGIPALTRAIDPSQTGLTETAGTAGYGTETPSLTLFIANSIQYVLGIIGLAFLVLLVYGGILWMTATGSTEQVKKAKGILTNSIIGLVIVIAAYAIAIWVTQALVGAVTEAT